MCPFAFRLGHLLSFFCSLTLVSAQTLSNVNITGSTAGCAIGDVISAKDGSFVSLLSISGVTDIDPGPGVKVVSGADASGIAFFDASNDFLWGGVLSIVPSVQPDPVCKISEIGIDDSSNVYVFGDFLGDIDVDIGFSQHVLTTTQPTVFLVKYDRFGSVIWAKKFDASVQAKSSAMAVNRFGSVVISGTFWVTFDADPNLPSQDMTAAQGTPQSASDVFLICLSHDGEFEWAHRFGDVQTDHAGKLALDDHGRCFAILRVTSSVYSPNVDIDPGPGVFELSNSANLVVSLEADGSTRWIYPIFTNSLINGEIKGDGSGGCYWLAAAGNGTDIDPDPLSSYIVYANEGLNFVLQIDATGNFHHALRFSCTSCEGLNIVHNTKGLVIMGTYSAGITSGIGTMDFDMDLVPELTTQVSFWLPDYFIASYDVQNQFVSAFSLSRNLNEQDVQGGISTRGNELLVAGEFNSTVDFDVHPDSVQEYTAWGGRTGFLAMYERSIQFDPCYAISISASVLLSGPYDQSNGLMNAGLITSGFFPYSQQYSSSGYIVDNSYQVEDSLLSYQNGSALVDWVVVELRDPLDPSIIIESTAAIVQRDGNCISSDGRDSIGFCSSPGMYFISIRHRNHFGVMTASPVNLTSETQYLGISSGSQPVYGTNAMKVFNGTYMLWSGDVNNDGLIRYLGPANDRDEILIAVGGSNTTNVVHGYLKEDINLDGSVKYIGANNDRDIVLLNIGGSIPTNNRFEQLP